MKTALEHLAALISIPSVSSQSNRGVIDYAASVLKPKGWSLREFTYPDARGVEKVNCIAAPPGQSPDASAVDLVFVCHTDTVPFAADWSAALEPTLKDGFLRGCGSCDVKSVLACLLALFEQTACWSQQLRLVLTAEEEIGCLGAKRLLANGMPHARRMVVGEPTSLQVARAGKGYCLAEVTVQGREAHSALPEQGASAIAAAAEFVSQVYALAKDLEQQQHSFFAPCYTTMNIGTIAGGTARNVVAGQCVFPVEWRPIPGQSPLRVPQSLAAIAARVQEQYAGVHVDVKVVREQGGFETAADTFLVRQMEALTQRPAVSISFGSEASIFAAIAEQVVVFGPGDMATAHSDRECVPCDELEAAVACYRALLGAEMRS